MAVDHDVDLVADRLAHGADVLLGIANGLQALDRHRFGDRHRLEGCESLLDGLPGEVGEPLSIVLIRLVEVLEPATAEVTVGTYVVAHRTAPQFRAGQVGDLAEDIPQGDVDSGDGGSSNDPAAMPEVLAIHHLPQMLDPGRVFADEQHRQILDGTDDAPGVPLQGGLAPAVEAGLIGYHLDKDPVAHACVADQGLNAADLHPGTSPDTAASMVLTMSCCGAYPRSDRALPMS